jgi:carbon storage regulator
VLVITRRAGERLLIGDQVWLTVLAVRGQQVRLGIDAPREVAIRREELPPHSAPPDDGAVR